MRVPEKIGFFSNGSTAVSAITISQKLIIKWLAFLVFFLHSFLLCSKDLIQFVFVTPICDNSQYNMTHLLLRILYITYEMFR